MSSLHTLSKDAKTQKGSTNPHHIEPPPPQLAD